MLKKNNKKGFTLVELLAVLVIMGIIMGITIPSVVQIANTQRDKKYSYHEQIVKQAVDAYIDQYRDTFEEEQGSCACYNIPYHLLVDEGLVKEEDVTCSQGEFDDQNVILAYPLDDSNRNFRYEYYLTCSDNSDGSVIHQQSKPPFDCCGVNGSFIITEAVVKYNDENGAPYPQNDNNWTKENIYQRFSASSPYMAGIKGYEYSLDGGNSWTYVASNSFVLKNDVNAKIQVRAVDNDNNRSSVYSYYVRIDKTGPNTNLIVESQNLKYNTSSAKVIPNSVDAFSGIKDMCVQLSDDISKCEWRNYASATLIMDTGHNYDGQTVTFNLFVRDKLNNVGKTTTNYTVYKSCTTTAVSWNGWGSCSAPCGGGSMKRSGRKYDVYLGTTCQNLSDSSSCNTHSCPSSGGGGGGGDSGGGNGGTHCCFGGQRGMTGAYYCWGAPTSEAGYNACQGVCGNDNWSWPSC